MLWIYSESRRELTFRFMQSIEISFLNRVDTKVKHKMELESGRKEIFSTFQRRIKGGGRRIKGLSCRSNWKRDKNRFPFDWIYKKNKYQATLAQDYEQCPEMITKQGTIILLLIFLPIFWAHYCIMKRNPKESQVTGLVDLRLPWHCGYYYKI